MANNRRSVGFTFIAVTTTKHTAFNANSVTFVNKGTVNVTIGTSFILQPGQSFTNPCWPDEIDNTVYDIYFPSPPVNGCLLIVICKNYND
jgi:hypothetical protein